MSERGRKQLRGRRICIGIAQVITPRARFKIVVSRRKRSKRKYKRSTPCMRRRTKPMKMMNSQISLKKQWKRNLKTLIYNQATIVAIGGRERMAKVRMEKLKSSDS
jgi:hypothetical protein